MAAKGNSRAKALAAQARNRSNPFMPGGFMAPPSQPQITQALQREAQGGNNRTLTAGSSEMPNSLLGQGNKNTLNTLKGIVSSPGFTAPTYGSNVGSHGFAQSAPYAIDPLHVESPLAAPSWEVDSLNGAIRTRARAAANLALGLETQLWRVARGRQLDQPQLYKIPANLGFTGSGASNFTPFVPRNMGSGRAV